MLAHELGVMASILCHEIPFVQHDDGRLLRLLDQAGDFFVLARDPAGGIDDQHIEIGAEDGFFGAHHAENLDRRVVFRAVPDARRVAKDVGPTLADGCDINGIARRPRDFADGGPFVIEDRVDEGGFSDVRASDNGKLRSDNRGLGIRFRRGR